MGLKLKPLNEYVDENDEALDDPKQDAEIFGHVFKETYREFNR